MNRKPARGRSRRDGFSMIEALVVMMLLAIVGTMAMPSVGRSMTEVRLDRATQVIAADLENAFLLAARQRRPIQFTVDDKNVRYVIADRATSGTIQSRRMGSQSAWGLSELDGIPATVTIFPSGLASSSFNIYLWTNKAADLGRVVRVARTGRIKVDMP